MGRLYSNVLAVLALGASAVHAQTHVQPMPTQMSTVTAPVVVRTLAADPAKPEKIGAPTTAPVVMADGSCGAWYNQGCQGCGPSGHLLGGVGVDWLKPHFNNNPAYTRSFTQSGVSRVEQVDHDWDYELGFNLWLGYVGCDGFGARLRYREFEDASALLSATVAPGESIDAANSYLNHALGSTTVGARIEAASDLRYDILDLEAIQNLRVCSINLVVFGGLRYAHVNQNFVSREISPAGALAFQTDVGHNFRGIGPTFGLEAYHHCSASLALFATSRVSLLYGDATYNAEVRTAGVDLTNTTRIEQDSLLPIFELEFGVQASACCSAGRLFGQLGIRGEYWLGGNNASRAAGFDVDDLTITDFGLVGLMLRLGIDY